MNVADWTPTPIQTSWDDLLDGVDSSEAWKEKRKVVWQRYLSLLRDGAAPERPENLQVEVEHEWHTGEFTIRYVSYQVEADERAQAYIGVPDDPAPQEGFPGVVCLHGTTNWGARRTLGMLPELGDSHADKSEVAGKDFARQLVRRGYVTISPEHFCCASRLPEEGPYDTATFYRKHPDWSAVGKYTYDSAVACTVLENLPNVDATRLGVTGHSLGGQGSVWLAAYDKRIKCATPSCTAGTFRENPSPLHWSRDRWHIYFPQLREGFLAGRQVQCDFHGMFSLIAPRPVLDRFALNDGDPMGQSHRVMIHLKLNELYKLLGHEEAHAFLTFGDGHAIPDISWRSFLSWMNRWLKYDGAPLDGWDASVTPSQ